MKRFILTTVFGIALVALAAWEINALWDSGIKIPYWYQIMELGACAPIAAFCGEKVSKKITKEWIKARKTNNRYIRKDLA